MRKTYIYIYIYMENIVAMVHHDIYTHADVHSHKTKALHSPYLEQPGVWILLYLGNCVQQLGEDQCIHQPKVHPKS